LAFTDFVIRDGVLEHHDDFLPDAISLERRLELIGGITFFRQTRVGDKVTRVQSLLLVGKNKDLYSDVPLHLNREDGRPSDRIRYSSEWVEGRKPGQRYRIYV
jgi:hypothetical protein